MKNKVIPAGRQGFTIIEMIVVLAIIAMLFTIIFALIGDSKKASRDSRREEDIKEIQNALALYATDYHFYPACPEGVIDGITDCLSAVLVPGGYISAVPIDPLGNSSGICGGADDHVYCYTSLDGFDYALQYSLETDKITGKSAGWQTPVGP